MNHEHQPPEQPSDEPSLTGAPGPWDPAEQVGDIYRFQADDEGNITHAERLSSDHDEPADDNEPGNHELPPDERPRIWVGSWADYNNGILYGHWIDADQDLDDIQADIQAMLDSSPEAARSGIPAEDWGIFDYDNFGTLRVAEQDDLSWVTKAARGIREHGLAFAAWADVMEDEDALDGFTDSYLGHFDSLEDYVHQYIDDAGYEQLLDDAIPESLRPYVRINIAQLAHDLQLGGDIHVIAAEGGGVWLFHD